MATSLKTLIGKLSATSRAAAERAANLCVSLGHHEVDVEHLSLALLEQPASDFSIVLRRSGIDGAQVQTQLEAELKRFKSGCQRTPVFAVRLPALFEHAWLIASLDGAAARIRSGHLLLALLTDEQTGPMMRRSAPELEAVRLDELKHHFDALTDGSKERQESGVLLGSASVPTATGAQASPALDQYTIDLTERARQGLIDPVIGREPEIRQLIDILTRRRQNNPILTGEAGVGKTAVVEGLALKIAAGQVPPSLQPVCLRVLDMGLLQAGASVKGEFENRLKGVIDEVRQSSVPVVLFVDEAHTLIGAGGQAGQNDAANLLKPALARGELRTIAATTWSEYKQYFEKDAALARRFQLVKVDEPDESLAASMLRGMVPLLERHFGVRVQDEAVEAAVRLSHRYISARQLPDKAVSVLDTACARVALGRSTEPALIDEHRQELERLRVQRSALVREQVAEGGHADKIEELDQILAQGSARLASNEERYRREKELVAQIDALRAQLEADAAQPGQQLVSGRSRRSVVLTPKQKQWRDLQASLRVEQGGQPLVQAQVDAQTVAEVVSAWTGIPLGRMMADEIQAVLSLKQHLAERVIGQDHALEAIEQRMLTSRAGLEDPHKPKGVFLFVGPSGVGKTETALALADTLYGGERKLITINMSEYQEAHSVSGLKGSPPGYVGYGQGGVLTEAVRRQPYSVVLLDEVEKAHPDVLELFFQVFDKGFMDDAQGQEIDFRNTLIILTSNVASSAIMQACLAGGQPVRPEPAALLQAINPILYRQFKPAFLGRLAVVPFYPIDDDSLARIITLKLQRIADRFAQNHQARLEWDDSLVDAIYARCTEVDSGARNVDNILNGSLLPEIAGHVLSRMAQGQPLTRVRVTALKNGQFRYRVG
ncbi:MAG TPA: type VI secretion system ATPase TssH [Alcaligenes sp.]|nr:type VI secretion system ATPase TssH [Alcaligenes sp.]HRL27182.1 type VI secretion system ATPase TssH [Alcaligenes sp.]